MASPPCNRSWKRLGSILYSVVVTLVHANSGTVSISLILVAGLARNEEPPHLVSSGQNQQDPSPWTSSQGPPTPNANGPCPRIRVPAPIAVPAPSGATAPVPAIWSCSAGFVSSARSARPDRCCQGQGSGCSSDAEFNTGCTDRPPGPVASLRAVSLPARLPWRHPGMPPAAPAARPGRVRRAACGCPPTVPLGPFAGELAAAMVAWRGRLRG